MKITLLIISILITTTIATALETPQTIQEKEENLVNKHIEIPEQKDTWWNTILQWTGIINTPEETIKEQIEIIENEIKTQNYDINKPTLINVNRYKTKTETTLKVNNECAQKTETIGKTNTSNGTTQTYWISCTEQVTTTTKEIIENWQEICTKNDCYIINKNQEYCYETENEIICKSTTRCDGWLKTNNPPTQGCEYTTINKNAQTTEFKLNKQWNEYKQPKTKKQLLQENKIENILPRVTI